MPDIGEKAPSFSLPANGEQQIDYPSGNPAVIYFYPKDDTPGCTTEAEDFSRHKADFDTLGVTIIGISPDTAARHDKFTKKHDLSITLVADVEHKTLEDYGVWVEKSMYGKTYMGVERTTFLVDKDGSIVHVWRKVKAKGHAEAVLAVARDYFD